MRGLGKRMGRPQWPSQPLPPSLLFTEGVTLSEVSESSQVTKKPVSLFTILQVGLGPACGEEWGFLHWSALGSHTQLQSWGP